MSLCVALIGKGSNLRGKVGVKRWIKNQTTRKMRRVPTDQKPHRVNRGYAD